MIVRLPKECAATIVQALHAAAERETGGILMGEHVGVNDFRITELTVQQRRGTITRFVRLVEQALVALQRFFRQTGNDYRRFNYLGEWHSHPLFLPQPSSDDDAAMMAIVTDEHVGANFVVLLITRLVDGQLSATASIYTRSGRDQAILMLEQGTPQAEQSESGQSDVFPGVCVK